MRNPTRRYQGGSSGGRAATLSFMLVLCIVMFLLGMTFRPLMSRMTSHATPPLAATANPEQLRQAVADAEHNNYRQSSSSPSALTQQPPRASHALASSSSSSSTCETATKQHYLEYYDFAQRGEQLRKQVGTLKIACFSRLWVPPIHGTGGMQYHALHLYSQLAARGHYVHVFVTGHPHGQLKKLYFRINPGTLHVEDEPDISKAKLVVEQVPSEKNGEYSEVWYENCLTRFRDVNRSIGGFHVAHSESWAGVPNVYQVGLQMLVTWHGSMLDWFRNEMNLIVHNYRMKGKMTGSNTASRMSNLGSSVAYEAYQLLAVPHHVVISDSAANDLREINLVDPDSIHLIYNGVNPQNFKPPEDKESALAVRRQFLTEAKVDVNDFIVGCGGRLDGIKGHHQLSQAMRIVLKMYKNVTLLVAGSGGESSRYEAMIRDGLKVVLLGMLPQQRLATFYQSLDVFVDPFYQHHGLNTVMLEAVLSSIPIIATRLASAQTTAPCEDYGRTFALGHVQELADQVIWMMKRPEERLRIGKNVRERAIHLFSSEIMAGSYESLFYNVLAHPKPLEPLTGKVVCRRTYPAMCYREPHSAETAPS